MEQARDPNLLPESQGEYEGRATEPEDDTRRSHRRGLHEPRLRQHQGATLPEQSGDGPL